MTIKGVLFDFDGTLTFPGALDFPAIKQELGCPADQAILEYLETLPTVKRSELMKILEEIEDQAAEASRPNRGAEKCIAVLKGKPLKAIKLNINKLVIGIKPVLCCINLKNVIHIRLKNITNPTIPCSNKICR